MFKKQQVKVNIEELDNQINTLMVELQEENDKEVYETKLKRIEDLTKVRCQLQESKTHGSHSQTIVSGALSIASILIILKYEKTDVITSKGFGIAQKLFRGV